MNEYNGWVWVERVLDMKNCEKWIMGNRTNHRGKRFL